MVELLTHPLQAPDILVSYHAKRAIKEFHQRAVPSDAFNREFDFDNTELELEELRISVEKVEKYRRFFNNRVDKIHEWDNPLFVLPILPTEDRSRDPAFQW